MRDTHPSQSRSAVADKIVGAPRRVTGKAIPAQTQQRRLGDSAVFVADGQKARQALGWPPRFEDLGAIVDQRQLLPAATRGPTPA